MFSNTIIKNRLKKQIIFSLTALVLYLAIFALIARVAVLMSSKIAHDSALAVKQNMLKDTVDNVFLSIDVMREDIARENPEYSEEQIKKQVFDSLYRRIHYEAYHDGAYMWASEVIDYSGGDDYAIRIIHPNLKDSEGTMLSTNEVNSAGTQAYKEELEGVKKYGYVFLKYPFKKLNSNVVTEKITYSRLYKDYDWIISMGINIDDSEHYIIGAEKSIQKYRILIYVGALLLWSLFAVFILRTYKKMELGLYEQQNQELKDKLSVDVVTRAYTRVYGERKLDEAYKVFLRGGGNTFIAFVDIDYFKKFNDIYGHQVGDEVLKAVVNAVRKCIRTSDMVIRFGGDEFIITFKELSEIMVPVVGGKILDSVRNVDLSEFGVKDTITLSMGFANFEKNDTSYMDAFRRADYALYKSKEKGRNCFSVYNENGEME